MIQILEATEKIISITVVICLIGIAISLLLLLIRVIIGPTNPDRAVALDVIGINLMAIVALMSIVLVTNKLNDVVLLIGILSFLSTLAIAKYLEKGVIIDRNLD